MSRLIANSYNLCAYRTHVDSRRRAVTLDNFEPSTLAVSILRKIYDQVGAIPYLYGGALRDEYAKHIFDDSTIVPNDYDVLFCITDTAMYKRLFRENGVHEYLAYDAINRIAEQLSGCKGFIKTSEELHKEQSGSSTLGRIRFDYEGVIIDIGMTSKNTHLPKIAMYGDAIPNSIAMNNDKEIMCHPDFVADMEEEWYVIRVQDEKNFSTAMKRFSDKVEQENYLGDFQLMRPGEYRRNLELDGL